MLAYAKLGYEPHKSLMAGVSRSAGHRLKDFTPQVRDIEARVCGLSGLQWKPPLQDDGIDNPIVTLRLRDDDSLTVTGTSRMLCEGAT